MKRIGIIALFAVFLFACKSHTVITYDILKPAKYTIPPEVKSIVLVNNCYPFVNKDIHFIEAQGEINVLDSVYIEAFADSVLLSLKESLLMQRFFDTVFLDTSKYNTLLMGKPLKKLTNYEVGVICDRYGAEGVLALDGYKYGSKVEAVDYGGINVAFLDANASTFWRFYDRINQDIIFEDLRRDTLYWSEEANSTVLAVARLPKIEKAIIEVGFYVGEDYVKHLVPSWETKEQRLYVAGNLYFVSGAEWYAKKNYTEAQKLWSYVYEHGTKIEKARAAYNIAISFEQQNDVASALKWGFNSYEAYKNVKTSVYADEEVIARKFYVYLAHRKTDVAKLNQQIGGGL